MAGESKQQEWPEPLDDPPDDEELQRMVVDSVVDSTDGCLIEPDGVCEHGYPSWLIYLGLV